jgi:hypothetical protein
MYGGKEMKGGDRTWLAHTVNSILGDKILGGPCTMHGSIVILEKVITSRKMPSYHWPQMFIEYFLIFCSINVTLYCSKCTDTIL